MKSFVVTFYDRFKWIVDGNDSLHVRKRCREDYPGRMVVSVVEVIEGYKL